MMNNFSELIISWYNFNKRNLPWRKTNDPYKIWLSEIILQQTQVIQGLPYYRSFTKSYPNVNKLAKAKEDEVLKLWQGLGYYSRARNLHYTAREIVKSYNGCFPDSFEALLKLKGIGRYTAAAIASIAFNKPHAVVDGNVYRLLSRYFGIKTAIDSVSGKRNFEILANKLLDKNQPGLFNQAMMELGATVCKPKNPLCGTCPLYNTCFALDKGKINMLPVKGKKITVKNRWIVYLIIIDDKSILLRKRTEKDIWKNLYDFPCIESDTALNPEKILLDGRVKEFTGNKNFVIRKISKQKVHKLTHLNIHAAFIEIAVNKVSKPKGPYEKADIMKLSEFPYPQLIAKYLESEFGI